MHNSIGKRELLIGGLAFALRAGYRLSAANSRKMPPNPASQMQGVLAYICLEKSP